MNPGDTHQGSIDELLGANPSAELIQKYSNQLHVDAKAPRAYITYSTNDGTVAPATNGKAYYDALVAKNVPVTLKTYSTGGHGWSEIDGLVYDPEWSMHSNKSTYYALSYDTQTDVPYKAALNVGSTWSRVKI
jgi:acetyl esterase/lipase